MPNNNTTRNGTDPRVETEHVPISPWSFTSTQTTNAQISEPVEEDAPMEDAPETEEAIPSLTGGFFGSVHSTSDIQQAVQRMRQTRMRFTNTTPFGEGDDNEDNEMATVGEYAGHRPDISSTVPHPMVVGVGKVGIEVELEQTSPLNMVYWNSITDHSLRDGGIEYVMKQPLGGQDLQRAIFELDSSLHSLSPNPSWRCSTHVHLDVRDLTVPQLKKFILTYTALEGVIFDCSGMQRWDNNFCPSFGFAQAQIQQLSKIWEKRGRTFVRSLDTSGNSGDRNKYSSLNFLPIRRQGSVEFRGAEAKFRKGQLLRLANRILSIREFAVSFEGSEVELIRHIASVHPAKILKKSMPPKWHFDPVVVHQGCDLAMDIIHLHKMQTKSGSLSKMVLRCRNENLWGEYFSIPFQENYVASVLMAECSSAGVWIGDFITSDSYSELQAYCNENNISL